MHSGDNKEVSPYTAIKSNDVMDFLGNPTTYVCGEIVRDLEKLAKNVR